MSYTSIRSASTLGNKLKNTKKKEALTKIKGFELIRWDM